MLLQDLRRLLQNVKQHGDYFAAQRPRHDDNKNSLLFGENSNGKVWLDCKAGCTGSDVLAALSLSFADLYQNNNSQGDDGQTKNGNTAPRHKRIKHEFVCAYDYRDEHDDLIYQNCRYLDTFDDGTTEKSFTQRQPDAAQSDGWLYNLKNVQRVPYRLPELLAADKKRQIILTEGEKDADNLATLSFVVSSFKNWREEWNKFIADRHVCILQDHDKAGVKQAEKAAQTVSQAAKSVKVVDLFDDELLPDKNGLDVSDWLEAGHTSDELQNIIKNAPLWSIKQPAANSKKQSTSGFVFSTLDELLAEPDEETAFVWDKTLPVGGFSICSAKPKVGKSTMARNLAVCVKGGEPFLGRDTLEGKVIYLCLEEKRAEVKRHFAAMGASGQDMLIFTGRTPENALVNLRAAIAEHTPVLVIIDPLSRFVRVNDFNDYAAMTKALEPFTDLARQTGTHILAVHHDGKGDRDGGDALLGSTALFGAVDCHIQMKKRGEGRTILTTNRYGEDLPEIVIDLDKETGLIVAQGDLQTVRLTEKKLEILAAIGDLETLTETDIKERIGANSKGVVSKAIRELSDSGELTRSGDGKKGNPYLYAKTNSKNHVSADKNAGFVGFSNSENLENLERYELTSVKLFDLLPLQTNGGNVNGKTATNVYDCRSCTAKIPLALDDCPACGKRQFDF